MSEKRIGRQTPTTSIVCKYENTHGNEAVESYNESDRKMMDWQESAMFDILAYQVDDDGTEEWVHSTVGYEIPRRNGKGEILVCRELWGLEHGESGLHTAHLATTSGDAAERLNQILLSKGYKECLRPRNDQEYPKQFAYAKQKGQQVITFLFGSRPSVCFRTRTGSGALGQGFDYVIIDEAQEYTQEQATALAFITSAAKNPQTIMCGTPPTIVSKGTVFPDYRTKCIGGETENSLWFEWSISKYTEPAEKDAWYECNPSLGITLKERAIKDEIAKTTPADFNIQRFGLWILHSQKSAISEPLWKELEIDKVPQFKGYMQIGIKFGKTGNNVAMGIGIKTSDDRIYTEVIDCRPISAGYGWMINFILSCECQTVAIDGANGQTLTELMKETGIKKPITIMTVADVVKANADFWQGLGDDDNKPVYCHSKQPSVDMVATNCEKRLIGNNGGFGFKAIDDDAEIALLDCSIIAFWLAKNAKAKKKQTVSY